MKKLSFSQTAPGVHQGLDHAAGPVPGPVQAVLGAVQGVQGGQGLVVAAGPQGVQQIRRGDC